MKKIFYIAAVLCFVAGAGFLYLSQSNNARAATFTLVQTLTPTSETTGTGTYSTPNFGSSVTVGNSIICVVTLDNGPSLVTSLTDTLGNTFVMDFEQDSATPRAMTIWRAPITTGGTDAITINYDSSASNNSAVVCQEWSYGAGTLTKDQTKGNAATSASLTTGASAATTQSVELVVVGSVTNSTNTTCTATGSYSNATFKTVANANACMVSLETSSTGAQTGTMSWTTSRPYGAGLVTYYVAGGGGGGGGGIGLVNPANIILFGDW